MSRFPPGAVQPPHRDRNSRISVLLSGALAETVEAGEARLVPGDVLLKSREVRHEDRFGPQGAVVLALEYVEDDPFSVGAAPWRRGDGRTSLRLVASLLDAARGGDLHGVEAAGADLFDSVEADNLSAARPPDWIARLRDEVEAVGLAGVDVAARARDAGVHAVHASRLFRRCYGRSLTEHAQAHAVRRALALMDAPGAPLSEVALAAGFYDQSHMSRVFRRFSGRSPGAFRACAATLAGG